VIKFEIVDTGGVHIHHDYVPRYIVEDFSFAHKRKNYFHDFSFTVNTLELDIDNNMFLCGAGGYAPHLGWKKIHAVPPPFDKGGVRALIDFDYVPGGAYRINNQVWPEYVNVKSGWVCIGDYQISTTAIEFANGCVAVLNKGSIKALWLKPISLPGDLKG